MPAADRDDAPAVTEVWKQARLARSDIHANQLMRWYVDPREGHDDLLVAVVLAVEAAQHSRPVLRSVAGCADDLALPHFSGS